MAEYVVEYKDEGMYATCAKERIVRCRDCKNYRPAEDDEHEDGCALAYAYLFDTSPDGFCAWSEPRKED